MYIIVPKVQLSFQFQLPIDVYPRKEKVVAQVYDTLSFTWETLTEFSDLPSAWPAPTIVDMWTLEEYLLIEINQYSVCVCVCARTRAQLPSTGIMVLCVKQLPMTPASHKTLV